MNAYMHDYACIYQQLIPPIVVVEWQFLLSRKMQGAQVGPSVKLSFSHLLYRRYIIIIHAASNIDALQARGNELNKHAAAVNLH